MEPECTFLESTPSTPALRCGLTECTLSPFLQGYLCSAFKESLQVEKKYSKGIKVLSTKWPVLSLWNGDGFLGVVNGMKQNDVCKAGRAWSVAAVSRGDPWKVCCCRLGRKGRLGGVWTWRAVMKILFFLWKKKWGAAVKSENLLTYRNWAKKKQEAIVTGFKPGKGWHRSQSNCVSHWTWYDGGSSQVLILLTDPFLKLSLCTRPCPQY